MATFLQLTNRILNELNEPELTSSNFSSSRGIQTVAKNMVNKSIHDIYNSEVQWPFLHSDQTDALTAGTQEYGFQSDARQANMNTFVLIPSNLITNGTFTSNITSWSTTSGSPANASERLRLNSAGAEQSISTIVNKEYVLRCRTFGGDITLNIGTGSGGTQISTQTLSISNLGDGEFHTVTFTATTTSTFIGFSNSASANYDVDSVEVSENISPRKLVFLSYNEWLDKFSDRDLNPTDTDQFGIPYYVYETFDDKYGLTPIPDRSTLSVRYEYYKTHTDLSSHGDSPDLPSRYDDVVVNRGKYYCHILRANIPAAQLSEKDYKEGLARMRIELINTKDYIYPAGMRLYNTTP